jgi:hypothetical protein
MVTCVGSKCPISVHGGHALKRSRPIADVARSGDHSLSKPPNRLSDCFGRNVTPFALSEDEICEDTSGVSWASSSSPALSDSFLNALNPRVCGQEQNPSIASSMASSTCPSDTGQPAIGDGSMRVNFDGASNVTDRNVRL